MSGVYEREGVRFCYPENWELTDETPADLPRVISVQSPTSGFWALHLYTSSANPADLADEARATLQAEYESLEAESVSEKIGLAEAVGYDMDFYCLDFLATARVRAFRSGELTLLVLAQAESRDFETLRDVFQAITVSLRVGS